MNLTEKETVCWMIKESIQKSLESAKEYCHEGKNNEDNVYRSATHHTKCAVRDKTRIDTETREFRKFIRYELKAQLSELSDDNLSSS